MSIAGAEDFLKAGKPTADISGIEADDKTGRDHDPPDGPRRDVLQLAGLDVRRADARPSTPPKDQTKKPPPGVGPYVITKSEPEREFVLRKRADFSLPGIPKPKLEQITVRVIDEPRRETEQVIDNRLDYMVDPPAPDLLPTVREKHADRFTEHTTVSTYFFFLNSKIAPFDKREVREAANLAIDNRAVARLFGGLLTPGCNFLPPGLPGHRPIEPCPWGAAGRPRRPGPGEEAGREGGRRGRGGHRATARPSPSPSGRSSTSPTS